MKNERQPDEPEAHAQTHVDRRRLPGRKNDEGSRHDDRRRNLKPVTSPPLVSSRRSSDGFTWRTSSSGTIANSSETSTPMPIPCAAADNDSPYATVSVPI